MEHFWRPLYRLRTTGNQPFLFRIWMVVGLKFPLNYVKRTCVLIITFCLTGLKDLQILSLTKLIENCQATFSSSFPLTGEYAQWDFAYNYFTDIRDIKICCWTCPVSLKKHCIIKPCMSDEQRCFFSALRDHLGNSALDKGNKGHQPESAKCVFWV